MVKNYILDTNVLIHDPNCIFKFEDNNLIIPFPVIEEIDKLKTRSDKVAKSARDVARIWIVYEMECLFKKVLSYKMEEH